MMEFWPSAVDNTVWGLAVPRGCLELITMGASIRKMLLFFSRMVIFSISNARYTYVHDQKYPSKDVDIHHIVSRRSNAKYLVYATALLVLACALYLYVLKVCLPTFLFSNDSRILKILWLLPSSYFTDYISSINRENQLVLCITACFLTYFLSSCYLGSLLRKVRTCLAGFGVLKY